ncbi:MAG TPA: S8 family serine peptidase, partial [Candidatus Acidoferrum sp.]|nr:S8 family serine peptidase [Candidatus Acidoferrum sp.]
MAVIACVNASEIRLRNERIATPDKVALPSGAAAAKSLELPHSGLFLIQFTGAPRSEWLQQLRALGVSMVQYVPDNAFVARASGVRVKDLQQLQFVRWTGPFKPEHKLHGKVASQKQGLGEVEVSILLAQDSTAQQLGAARGLLKRIGSQSSMRFGHVWRGALNATLIAKLAESDAVLWVEAAPKMKLVDETASKIVGGDSGGHATWTQALGYDGSGVAISVADSGLHMGDIASMHPDLFGRVDALFFYGELEDASDEHGHGTHCAGIVAGNGATGELDDYGALWGLGVAPGAHIIAQRMFDAEGGYQAPPSFQALTTDAMGAGAEIGSNSWGDDTQGRYDISAAEFDALVRDGNAAVIGDQGYILEFSAGNAGPGQQTIGSPAVAKNVIATGASQNDRFDYFLYEEGREAMADFSSRGPAEDGRIKPDLVAPGTWISSLRSAFANDEYAWGDISQNYMFQGGTSQAGPHAAGAAAVFVQYFRETHTNATPSPALVKAALINSAWDMDDSVEAGPTPNMDEGWGRIDLQTLLDPARSYDYVDQSVKLATSQTFERRVVVMDVNQPLVITLAYTDVPGFPGALVALVNDLDLEVVAPDGQIFHGNQFDEGESIAGAPAYDNLNNVEGIYISYPQLGEYTVRVVARNVVQDARSDSAEIDQDFALVVSALMPAPGEGVVLFDRTAYTVPSRMNLKVIDVDLGAQQTVNITLKSATEPDGFAVTLKVSQFPGTFTGSVATATGTAVNDGVLQFAHGDFIRAEYFDTSAGILRTANALGDLQPPVISGVTTENQFGQALVVWQTDEPATSLVRFNTNSTLNRSATNTALVLDHALELTNLVIGATYQFAVISTDAAGNTATNNSGGTNFVFVAPTAATVLLVNAFTEPDPETGGDDPPLPITTYTDALQAAGVSFDVLHVTNSSSTPTFLRLLPYKVVIWRINDSFNVQGDTLSAQQQGVITQYLNAGGSFFMASMEILSRLGASSFTTNVFRVARFTPNTEIFEPCADCDEDHTVQEIEGEFGDQIGHGVQVALDY